MRYEIQNTTTGHSFGIYEGETPEAAIKAMRIDAGYPDGIVDDEVGGDDHIVAIEVAS